MFCPLLPVAISLSERLESYGYQQKSITPLSCAVHILASTDHNYSLLAYFEIHLTVVQRALYSHPLKVVLDNPTAFGNPFQFEITFECLQELEDDIEWKVIYVGSPETSTHDQVLDEILVGPVPVGINKFVLQADAPDSSTIPNDNILGVTVVLVTCSYKEQEFARIGYYVNNEYAEPYDSESGPPSPLDLNKVVRTILADKPRVTRFPINWTGKVEQEQEYQNGVAAEGDALQQQQQQQLVSGDDDDIMMMDEEGYGDEEEEEEEEDDEEGDESGEIDLTQSSMALSPVGRGTAGPFGSSNAVVSPDDQAVMVE